MNGFCCLCMSRMSDGELPFCEECHVSLLSLPYDKRMEICLSVENARSNGDLAAAVSELSEQLTALIDLSQRWHPSHFAIPPPSRS